jgi:transcriptional regulator with XRE-family HTH domain
VLIRALDRLLKERDLETIATRIRDQRKALGLSQQELSNRAGLTLSLVSKIETNRITDLHLSTLEGLARALRISISELVGESAMPTTATATPPAPIQDEGRLIEVRALTEDNSRLLSDPDSINSEHVIKTAGICIELLDWVREDFGNTGIRGTLLEDQIMHLAYSMVAVLNVGARKESDKETQGELLDLQNAVFDKYQWLLERA